MNKQVTDTRLRPCPICGKVDAEELFRPASSPGPVGKCRKCGMVYVFSIQDSRALIFDGAVVNDRDASILTSANLDDVNGSWEFNGLSQKEAELPALNANATDFLQRIEPFVSRNDSSPRVLDFGSGWGFFLATAKERGWDAYGLEPLPATSVYARAKFGLKITTDTLREDTFPPNFFDAVTAFQVFEHLPFPAQDLLNLRKALRDTGLILIEVPNFDTWTMKVLRSKHRHFVQDHLNFFSGDTLGRFLEKNGFETLKVWQPTRRMTMRHLTEDWGGKVLPQVVASMAQSTVKGLGLWEKTVGLNLGDIVAVLARKRRS